MARTITVKGIGKASAKPDYVVFSMTLESKHKDYDISPRYNCSVCTRQASSVETDYCTADAHS